MSRKKNTMPVDKERLLNALREKEIDVYTAGELCKKSRRYVRNFVDRGLIGEDNIKNIEKYLGIPYSDYCPVDKKKNEEIDLYQLIDIAKNENIEIEICDNNGKKIRIRPLG